MSNTMAKERQPENKMGVMPINKLLLSTSLPMMISMLVQALYNIVDSIFVAQLGENALTAVSLAFPIQSLMIAVSVGTGVGVNAALSRALGERNFEKANMVADHGVFLTMISYILFLVIGIFAVRPFYLSQTDDMQIVEYGVTYLTICLTASFGLLLQIIFERLLQSTGKTFYAMITQGTGAIINIILDPILIFGLAGMPKMGIAGAAVATIIGQIIGGLLSIWFHVKKNREIQLDFKGFRLKREIVAHIYEVGVPAIIMQAIGSVMVYGMNRILIAFSSTATAVFGVYFKLQSFIFMPVFGLNNGMVPIIAYNYGAQNKERLLKIIRLSIFYAMVIMLVGLAVIEIMPGQLFRLFNASETMLAMGVPALRIICLSFVFAGFCIVCGSVFQALGNGVYSMIVSIARQLIVLLPTAYLLSLLGKVDYVWWSFPIAETASLAMTIFFMVRIDRKIIRHIGEK